MGMALRAVHAWNLGGLIVAFVDLAIAYILLCGSAFAFVPSKLLSFFGIYLPCPCSGFFGYQNDDLCLHRLLIDLPIRKINAVKELVKNRFPFDLILFGHESCNFHVEGCRKCGNGVIELEGEACSSSLSGPRLQSSVDRESGNDAKDKKIMNQKHKSGIRRRRRAAVGYGKPYPALSCDSTRSVGIDFPRPSCNSRGIRSEISEDLDPGSVIEDGYQGNQDVPNGTESNERTRQRFELDGSYEKGKAINRDQLSVEKFTCDSEDRVCSAGNYANAIRVLEQALKEEKAARAALYQELDEERTAAATAADEAMAMILRLQEDKASIEMEARQYHRVIEEKCAYDEEEMNILKEIIVRREREIHFLEKEVEAYEQMNFLGNDLPDGDSSYKINKKEQKLPLSIDSNENPLPVPQQIENSESIGEKEVDAKWSSNYEHLHTLTSGEEMMPRHEESASDFSASQRLVQKTPSVAGKEKTERDINMISLGMKAPQISGSSEEELKKYGEHWSQAGYDMHNSMLDIESTVYDVHVIDDKTLPLKENVRKESGPLSVATSDSGVQNSQFLSDGLTTSITEFEPKLHGSSSNMHDESLFSSSSPYRTLSMDSRRRSPSVVDDERLKIDNEVEWLRERLRIVQDEKEKLTFTAEHRERVSAQLRLVEDIVNHLREIQLLREPARQVSLPPSSSKENVKKRHHRSVSSEDFESS